MSKKFLTALDLNKNELIQGVIQNLPSAPGTPVKGQIYFDTGGNILYWYNGSGWVAAQGGAGAVPATTVTTSAVGDSAVVGVATTYAREDHKHAREAFAAAVAATTFALAKVDGVATTLARSDHHHGTPTHDAAAHAAIPLSALSAPTASLNINSQLLTNLAAPVSGGDATNKTYVDNLSAGLSWKGEVRAATTATITLSAPQTIDGVAVIATERVLVKNQSTASQNGIYVVAAGAWTRATDADTDLELLNASVFVSEGTTQADTAWVMTTNLPITVNTTSLAWAQFAGTGGSVPPTRNVLTTAPLTGGGTLAADLTLSITAAGITNALLSTVAANSFKGNNTGSVAAPIDMTVAQAKTLLAIAESDVTNLVTDLAAKQPLDTDLTTIAGLTATTGNMILSAGSAWTSATPATVKTALAIAEADVTNLVTDLAAKQPLDTDLTAIAGQTATTNNILQSVASAWASRTPTQVTATLDTFTATLRGLVPPPTTATGKFLKDDGTWATAGGGTVNKFTQATVGGATSQVITHNLASQAVLCDVFRTLTPWDTVECDIERTTTNTITLRFAVAPATNEYTVVVVG